MCYFETDFLYYFTKDNVKCICEVTLCLAFLKLEFNSSKNTLYLANSLITRIILTRIRIEIGKVNDMTYRCNSIYMYKLFKLEQNQKRVLF